MIRFSAVLLFMLSVCFHATAQDFSPYQKKYFIAGTDTLPYRLLLPLNYDSTKRYPLIFFMHGAGERGNNNESQLIHGGTLFLSEEVRKNYPAIVVFPQCPQNIAWSNVTFNIDQAGKREFIFLPDTPITKAMDLAQNLLYDLLRSYPIKYKQVYVGGLSMGGMGTFEMVRRNPDLFAAAVAICGGGNASTATKMAKTKWWIFHGAKDDVVPPALSQQMNDALLAAGAKVKYTVYPEAKHNSWDNVFAEPGLFAWLFAQHK